MRLAFLSPIHPHEVILNLTEGIVMGILNLNDFMDRVKEVRDDAGYQVKELWITNFEWNFLIADYKFHNKAQLIIDHLEPDCQAIINGVKIFTCDENEIIFKNKFIKAFSRQLA